MPDTLLLNKLRVLLVDDDSFIRRVNRQIITNLQIQQLFQAEDGLNAMPILKNNEVDILITDIQMPKMNGIELIKQIRTGNAMCRRHLKVIVVTNFSNTEVLNSCIQLNVNGFLVKPITPAGMEKKIKLAMQEQTSLASVEEYLKVNTDLKSLEQVGTEKSSKVNVSISKRHKDNTSKNEEGKLVSLINLKSGMQLLEDIYFTNGSKLVSSGMVLSENLINRIKELREVTANRSVRVN